MRIFAKPNTLKNRRMGVALAQGSTVEEAVERAVTAAGKVEISYGD
jgi:phosphoribosylglycinamide formyltransferase 2